MTNRFRLLGVILAGVIAASAAFWYGGGWRVLSAIGPQVTEESPRDEMLRLLGLGRTQNYHARYTAGAPERLARNEDTVIDVWRMPPRYRIDTTVRSDTQTTYTVDIVDSGGTVTSCERIDLNSWACSNGTPGQGVEGPDSLIYRVERESSGQDVRVESKVVRNISARCFTFLALETAATTLCLQADGIVVSLVSAETEITLQSLVRQVQDRDFTTPA